MTANIVNQVAYLKTSRLYPEEVKQLAFEVNKTYVDVANAVNARTIGLYSINRPSITGESWFLVNNQRQQSLRQVYTFTTTADIPLGFKISSVAEFSRFFGEYLSVTSWFGLIPATSVAIAGQITFFIVVDGTSTSSDLIRFVVGAGAPALTKGKVVIEWISDP